MRKGLRGWIRGNHLWRTLVRRGRVLRERLWSHLPGRRQGREQARCVVICGFPRSGTSLLFNMMAATLAGFQYEKRETSVLRTVWARGNWLNKTPNDIFRLAALSEVNFYRKRFDVLVVVRDPRDIITSIHPEYRDRSYIGYEKRHNPSVTNNAGVGRIYREVKALRAHAPAECTLSFLRYEDLVRDPDLVQRTIAEHHSLVFDGPFSEFIRRRERLVYAFDGQEAASRLEDKEADSSRVGKWRRDPRLRERVREQFSRYPELFTILIELGYEQDDRWFEELR